MKNRWLYIGRIQKFESHSGEEAARELGHNVNPNVAEMDEFHHRRTDGDCWIERAAGNRSDCEYAGQHRETDSQSVKTVVQSAFRGRAIDNDVCERESKEKLGDERGRDVRKLHRRPAF